MSVNEACSLTLTTWLNNWMVAVCSCKWTRKWISKAFRGPGPSAEKCLLDACTTKIRPLAPIPLKMLIKEPHTKCTKYIWLISYKVHLAGPMPIGIPSFSSKHQHHTATSQGCDAVEYPQLTVWEPSECPASVCRRRWHRWCRRSDGSPFHVATFPRANWNEGTEISCGSTPWLQE